MKKMIYVLVISLLSFTIYSCAKKSDSPSSSTATTATTDTTSPVIAQVTAVTTPTANTKPNYTFSSDEAGTITYGGSCSSSTTSATTDNNTISFSTLDNGTTYSDCTIKVTDSAANVSNTLAIPSFSIAQSKMAGAIGSGEALSLTTEVTLLAGQYTKGILDGTGESAKFYDVVGLTTDGTNLYASDRVYNSIRKIVISTGVVTTLAGTGVVTGGFVNGTGTSASFSNPQGITTDGTNLYVVDTGNHVIRKIVISSGVVTTFAGTGSSGYLDNETATSAIFDDPSGITNDGTNLYVTDEDNERIRQIVISSGVVTTLAGGSTAGAADGTGTSAQFYEPRAITTDGTNLYVTDATYMTIRKIVISTGVVTTLAGTGSMGSANGTGTSASFKNPLGITTDGTNLFVADQLNYLIRKIVISTGVVTTLAGSGSAGMTTGTGTSASFYAPIGMTTDGTNLYVGDTIGVRKIE
jgi:hypothetical protein